jgi:RHS repeat-associated protein
VVQLEDTYGLQWISEKQVISGTWTPSFYGYDGGGSVRQLTNAAGTVTDTYNYDAFGNLLNSTGSTPNNYLYRGEQYDQDLGLYYLRARYYNPATGRFLSRDPEDGDPTNPDTLHRYLYVHGDPVNASDPTGRAALFSYTNTLEWRLRSVIARAALIRAATVTGYCIVLNGISLLNEVLKKPDPIPIEWSIGCYGLTAASWAHPERSLSQLHRERRSRRTCQSPVEPTIFDPFHPNRLYLPKDFPAPQNYFSKTPSKTPAKSHVKPPDHSKAPQPKPSQQLTKTNSWPASYGQPAILEM